MDSDCYYVEFGIRVASSPRSMIIEIEYYQITNQDEAAFIDNLREICKRVSNGVPSTALLFSQN